MVLPQAHTHNIYSLNSSFFLRKKLFFILLLLCSHPGFSQGAKSEDEVKKNAGELFLEGEYSQALPLYSQLLSLYPKDPNYSYRFGACRIFAEKDKEAPLVYLEFGANDPAVEPEAWFFLGKAYHLNYRFDEALSMYKKFEEKGEEKSKERLLLARHIAMCENGKRLLKNISDIVVLDKKNLAKSDFFRNYNLAEFGGKIIKTPEEFKLAYDVKKKKESIMYLQPNAELVYFSSYGENGSRGKDIYFAKKTPDGMWGKPEILNGPVNTEFDEDYPFIHPNGTLYFSSTGHNSMGGYDIFKTALDSSSGQWSYPQNIDFAINTPGDDYLYITDMQENNAYFSSTRESSENEVTVYRVKVERIPIDIAIIKGTFSADTNKLAKITIEDLKDGKIAGVYNTSPNTGDYVFTIPNGGKFKFIVETPESSVTYSGMVDIPRQKTLKALKQEMQLIADNGEKKLIIKNLFDEEVTSDVSALLAEIYKQKATLEINADEIKQDTTAEEKAEIVAEAKDSLPATSEKTQPETNAETTAKNDNISNDEIIAIAKEDAKNLQKEASDLKLETEIAYSIANEKNNLSAEKAKEAEESITIASNALEPAEKQQKTDRARQLKKESKLYAEQAVAAFNLAREIEKTATEKQKEADIAFNYAQELENAAQQNSPEETAEKLAQLNDFFEKQKSQPETGNSYSELQKQIEEKQKEMQTQSQLAQKLESEVKSLETDVNTLKAAAKTEKKKKDRERLEQQAFILEKDLPGLQTEAQAARESSEKLQRELLDLEKQESILSSVVSQIKSSDKTSVTGLNENDKSKLGQEISSSEERITRFEQELRDEVSVKEEQPLVSIERKEEKTDAATAAAGSPNASATSSDSIAVISNNAPVYESESSEEQIPADYEPYFKQKVEESSAHADPLKKEEYKTRTYESWARAIEKEAAAERQKAEQATDETVKAELLGKAAMLENTAKEKRQLSQESQAAAVQLRLAAQNASVADVNADTASAASTPVNPIEKTGIASYSEKFVASEKNASSITDENEKAAALAEINREWAGVIAREIESLKASADTIQDENRKTERREMIQLLEEIKKEKEEKAESFAANEIPADYAPWFENRISAHETVPDPLKKEENKAREYERWAKAIEHEAVFLRQKSDSVPDGVEKSALLDKAAALESIAKEKRLLSQQSETTAAQLRLSSPASPSPISQAQPANADTSISAQVNPIEKTSIASYSEKYITYEMNAENITDEKEKSAALADINREWANTIAGEISSLKISADTIQDEGKKAEQREMIRLLEEVRKEKEEKAQQYELRQAPPEYSPWFEAKINDLDTIQNPLKKEEAKASSFEAWAKSIDKEAQQLKIQADTTVNEEERRILEEKIAGLEVRSQEKRTLSVQSREQADQLRFSAAPVAVISGAEGQTPDNVVSANVQSAVSLQDQVFIAKMEEYERQQVNAVAGEQSREEQAKSEEFKAELYREWCEAIEKDIQQLKVLRSSTTSETERQNFETLIKESEVAAQQKKSLASQSSEKAQALKKEADALPEITEAQVKAEMEKSESTASAQQADSLQTEAVLKRNTANEMGFFKKKKKAALLAEAAKTEAFSEITREKSELSSERASLLIQSENVEVSASPEKKYAYKRLESKAKTLESDAVYLDDQAKVTKDSLAIVKKKRQKEEIFLRASLLEQKAAAKREEAAKFTVLAGELKEKEETAFKQKLIKTVLEAEKRDSLLPIAQMELDSVEMESLKENEVLKSFAARRKASKDLYKQSHESGAESGKLRTDAGSQLAQFSSVSSQLNAIKDEQEKEQFVRDALEFASQAKRKLSAADSLSTISRSKEKSGDVQMENALEELYDAGDLDLFRKALAYQYLKPPDTVAPVVIADTSLVVKDTVSKPLPVPFIVEETFTLGTKAPVYNAENPIPLNPKYPEGLVWQVQIGAFRNPIPQDLFKGFAPIVGVKISDGITRYSAGMFKTFATANAARNEIVKLGYKDAFVVVYKDGQRISITEARSLIAKGLIEEATPAVTDISATPETTVASENSSRVTGVLGNQVDKMKDLFYTVQVGVYSKPASEDQLKNVQPVNSEKLGNGTIRYSSGVYKDIIAATEAKNTIVALGIKDAFVTAYYGGKRISVAEANSLNSGRNTAIQPPVAAAVEKVQVTNEQGIIFLVLLGAYKGDVPVKEAGLILEFTRPNGKSVKQGDGSVIYFSGSFIQFEEAEKFKNDAVEKGLNNATVVAYNNGKKVDIEDAKKK